MKKRTIDSPIGRLLLCADDAGICRIQLMKRKDERVGDHSCALLDRAADELCEYFEGKRQRFGFPLSMHGTAFEQAVRKALCEIPYGEIRTYGQIAAQIGMPKGARAIGGACSRNPILIAVPCHRVIAASGALTGFAAGMQAKRSLLALEGHAINGDRISY